jgi:hypothetical protein
MVLMIIVQAALGYDEGTVVIKLGSEASCISELCFEIKAMTHDHHHTSFPSNIQMLGRSQLHQCILAKSFGYHCLACKH